MCYFAYGAGFAMGNYIGICIEKKLAVGRSILRIITRMDATELIKTLREKGYGVSSVNAQGSNGNVSIIYMVIHRGDFERLTHIINKFNPKAFYTLEDVRFVSKGVFPTRKPGLSRYPYLGPFKYWRKGK